MNRWVRQLLPYVVALAVVAIAAILRALLSGFLGPTNVPFITFFAAVACAAWYGGLGPGIVALVASYFTADWFFIKPVHTWTLFDATARPAAELATFTIMAGLIVAMADQLRRAQQRARDEAIDNAQRQELLRITLASIGDGVIATDSQGHVAFMNAVAETLTGWSQQEAQGRSLTEVFHIVNEQTRQVVENPCEKVLRTGNVVGLANHTLLISRDGAERPIDDSAAPIFDSHGVIQGVVLVFVDATDQRKTHVALQQLAGIVEHSDDAVISKNRDGVITSWNAAAERLYGYTPEEAVGRHIDLIVPVHLRDELRQIMDQLWAGKHIEHWDTQRQRKDGTLVDVSLRISPIRNQYGEIIGASKVARDVTKRKRAEAALSFLADTSVALATLVDRDSALHRAAGVMVPFFADYCVVYIMQPNGAIGGPAAAHRDPDKEPTLRKFIDNFPVDWNSRSVTAEAWRTGKTQLLVEMPEAMQQLLAPSDEQLAVLRYLDPRSVLSVPLRIRDRTVGVITFVFTDSGRRYSAADLPFAEELGRRVAIAVDNAQLLASVKAADKQKDEFLAMLAHELRNPLAAIRYAVDASRIDDAPPAFEMIEVIDRQVKNLAHLIDDLLDISRISRGKIQLRREVVDAATIARRAAATVRPLIENRRHRLTVDVANEPMPLFADPTRAEQIVANLLTNAAKYTPEGGQVTLRTYRDGNEAVIKVADTGIGIAADTLPRVFELFAQADRTIDRAQGGLGIGLTVARELAELHGGAISADSEGIGHGAEFTVRLPLAEHLTAATETLAAASPVAEGSLRILVVDDNRDTALVESMLLKRFGHVVAVAHDGQAALEEAARFKPHAVLLDLGLPVLNGYEVAARLREQGFAREILIAVSGYGQAEDRERSLKAGFNHHLVKPVESDDLLAILHQIRPSEALGA